MKKGLVIDARESGTTTGRYVDKLVEYLHKLEPDLDVSILTKPHRIEYLKSVAPGYRFIPTNYKEFGFGEQLGFAWQIYKLKPELVHFGITNQPILYFGRTITTVHDLTTIRFRNPAKNWLIFKLKQWVYRGVIWIVAHKSRHILVPSEFVKNDLASYAHISPNKITVTHEAADKITDKPEPLKELQGKLFLMYVGRAQPHKNLRRLVDAYQEIKWVYPDLNLVFVGKRDGYKLLERYVKSRTAGDVVFTDFVTEGQLRWLYEHATAYVFPSLSEGFGLPALEAMQYSAPVISSNATCLPEIYKDAPLYFDPRSTKDLVARLREILDNPEFAKKHGQKGLKVAAQYSWKDMASKTLDVYNKILN